MKSKMTNNQRLMNFLSNREIDRTPIWLLFPYHKVGYYADVRTNPQYKKIFEKSKECAVMLNRRNLMIPVFSDAVLVQTSADVQSADADTITLRKTELSWNGNILIDEVSKKNGETVHKKMICNDGDLEAFLSMPVETDQEAVTKKIDSLLPAYRAEKEEFPREYGAMMLALGEPINELYHAAELSEYPVWSLTHNEQIRNYLDRAMSFYRIKYKYCLENDLADVYFLVGSEMASPPMVSRKTFQEWIVPYSRELCALVHSYGKNVITHYHGQIRDILPDFLDIGPDAIHTIEAPPVGNCTLKQAFDIVGDSIGLIGNIQYDCFRSYTPQEMHAAVKEVLEETKGKRFMLSPSAGPYEHSIPEQMQENYLTFMETGVTHAHSYSGRFR